MTSSSENVAETLNRECDCSVTDLPALRMNIDRVMGPGQSIVETHPHLFSETPVFLQATHVEEMRRVITAIESIVNLPTYQQSVLSLAPPIARIEPRAAGVLMGFDFHITPDGPKLIEVNTNAGGAFLNIAAQVAHRSCCRTDEDIWCVQPDLAQAEAQIVSMFKLEWNLARKGSRLRNVVIVDENPRAQYLYPEFQLAKRLLYLHGIQTTIADPSEFQITHGELRCGDEPVDLVYNRLTDFYFESPANHILELAYEHDLAVITPHPRAHSLYSNKRNLVLFSDAVELAKLGADSSAIEVLTRAIPLTREVKGGDERWWNDRKGWFFKPRHGFGSRGVYRGDKLTRRVFAEVAKGEYLAQKLTPASERLRSIDGIKETFKVDVR